MAAYLDTAGVDRRVIDLANQVTGRAGTPFDKAIALQDFFTGPSSGFQYSLQTAPGNGDDALVEFLTQGKTGYCEQFAAAMAVMLRAVGVPARVAVGFTGGTPDGNGSRATRESTRSSGFPRLSRSTTRRTSQDRMSPASTASAMARKGIAGIRKSCDCFNF